MPPYDTTKTQSLALIARAHEIRIPALANLVAIQLAQSRLAEAKGTLTALLTKDRQQPINCRGRYPQSRDVAGDRGR